ncbi:unnamed protein product [Prorocentrum cordatum]|uniref:Uncharacterized protein n=1 Tax=Prorocentrum cordatum TaxID=2364126 RepID=A0ABN9VKE0_9DINO|nr:unnamed protein product [Polarella glacialis]
MALGLGAGGYEEDDRLARLLPAFGQQVARGGDWPRPGDSVLIKDPHRTDWDGCAAHNSPHFLILAAGERVLVSHKNLDGFLFGTVEGAASMPERSGWFGGRGCSAAVEVVLPVPLGPHRPTPALPEGIPPCWADGMEPAEPSEASQGGGSRPSGGDSLEAVVAEYCRSNNVDGSAASALMELEPDLQRILLTRTGNLSNCRNPSAVLLTRIDRVKAGQPMNPGGPARGRSRSPRRAAHGLGSPGSCGGGLASSAQVEEGPGGYRDGAWTTG